MNFIPARLVEAGNGLAIRLTDDISLPGPPERIARYRAALGHDLVFGIRPEHAREARSYDNGPGLTPLTVTLDVVEPLGMETLVYFRVNGSDVCGRIAPESAVGPGEKMALTLDMNRMHLIDTATDRVL